MFFSLAIILGLIFLIKKWLLPKWVKTPSTKRIQILSKTFLDPQMIAILIGFEQKRWLVLSGRNGFTVLDQFEESKQEDPLAN